jgi:hypothetical protein
VLRAVPDHPKFAALKAILAQPKGAVAGWLEMLWHFAGRYTPQGNIGRYTDAAIETWLEWTGEPGALVRAFVQSGWIDPDPVHRLLVHDWAQHADKTTKNALGRAKLPFCTPGVRTEISFAGTAYTQRTYKKLESSTAYTPPVPEPVPVPGPGPVPVPEPEPVPAPGPQTAPPPAGLVPDRYLDYEDEIPVGLAPLQYADWVLEKAVLVGGFNLRDRFAKTIVAIAKLEGVDPPEAARRLLQRVKTDQDAGETINVLWVDDSRWKPQARASPRKSKRAREWEDFERRTAE